MKPSPASIISQKREFLRTSIRKNKQEDYFNSKRFSVLSKTVSTQMAIPLENESDLHSLAPLMQFIQNYERSNDINEFENLDKYFRKIAGILDSKTWFDQDFILSLIDLAFRHMQELEPNVIKAFGLMLEKIFLNYFHEIIKTLIEHRIIERLKKMLQVHRKIPEAVESVFFCYTQISTYPIYVDSLMNNDIVLEILITLMLEKPLSNVLVKMVSWLTYNMTTGVKDIKPYYNFGKYLFTVCAQMLESSNKDVVTCNLDSILSLIDEEKLDDFCFNKVYLINEHIHILEFVNRCYKNPDEDIKLAAIRIAYKVSLGKPIHASVLIEKGVITSILGLLKEPSEKIKKEVLVVLGNICDISKHLDFCLERGFLIEIFGIFLGDSSLELKKECVMCVAQATESMEEYHWAVLVQEAKILDLFCEALDIFNENEVIKLGLNGIWNVLSLVEDSQEKIGFCKKVVESQNLERILGKIMLGQDEELAGKAMEIMEIIGKF